MLKKLRHYESESRKGQLHQVCWAVWTPCLGYWRLHSSQKLMLLLLPAGIEEDDGPSFSWPRGREGGLNLLLHCQDCRGKSFVFRGKSVQFAYMMLLLLLLLSCFSRVQLCDPRDDSPPGSPIPGILQARTLEWVAIYMMLAVGFS